MIALISSLVLLVCTIIATGFAVSFFIKHSKLSKQQDVTSETHYNHRNND